MQRIGPSHFDGARVLCANDIDRVVAIDRDHTGHARWRFFEKRFAAAEAKPDDFVHIGVMRGGSLRGYIMVHLQRGEFGREDFGQARSGDKRRRGVPCRIIAGLGRIGDDRGVRHGIWVAL